MKYSSCTFPKTVAWKVCGLVYVAAISVKWRDCSDERPEMHTVSLQWGSTSVLPGVCTLLHLKDRMKQPGYDKAHNGCSSLKWYTTIWIPALDQQAAHFLYLQKQPLSYFQVNNDSPWQLSIHPGHHLSMLYSSPGPLPSAAPRPTPGRWWSTQHRLSCRGRGRAGSPHRLAGGGRPPCLTTGRNKDHPTCECFCNAVV